MKSRIRSAGSLVLFAAVFGFFLAGCGNTPVCVGGVGDCGWDPKLPSPTGMTGQPAGGVSDIAVSIDRPVVRVNDPRGIMISTYGDKGSVTYTIISPPSVTYGASVVNGVFKAPTQAVPISGVKFVIRAKDINGTYVDFAIWATN